MKHSFHALPEQCQQCLYNRIAGPINTNHREEREAESESQAFYNISYIFSTQLVFLYFAMVEITYCYCSMKWKKSNLTNWTCHWQQQQQQNFWIILFDRSQTAAQALSAAMHPINITPPSFQSESLWHREKSGSRAKILELSSRFRTLGPGARTHWSEPPERRIETQIHTHTHARAFGPPQQKNKNRSGVFVFVSDTTFQVCSASLITLGI